MGIQRESLLKKWAGDLSQFAASWGTRRGKPSSKDGVWTGSWDHSVAYTERGQTLRGKPVSHCGIFAPGRR